MTSKNPASSLMPPPTRDTSLGWSGLDKSAYPDVEREALAREAFGQASLGKDDHDTNMLLGNARVGMQAIRERLAVQPKAPKVDPLEVALEVARALSWWDGKVEAKAAEVPPDVWQGYLVEGAECRRKLLKALSKWRTYDPAKKREENQRRAEREKAARVATKDVRLAEIEAQQRDLRRQADQYQAVMDECVGKLPDKDKPPALRSPYFSPKFADLGARYGAAHSALLEVQQQARTLHRKAANLRRIGTARDL